MDMSSRIRIAMRIVLSLLFVVASVCGAPVTQQQAAAVDQQAKDNAVVAQFHQWCAGVVAAPSAEAKARLLPEGLALAKERREALKRIIREDPGRALTLTETASVRRSLPADVDALLEERISGVGEIRVRRDGAATAEISADGLAREARVNGRVFAVHVYGRRLVDQDFAGVPLQGVAVDGVLALAESPLRILDPEEVAPQQRQEGKIAADVGGQLQFFATREDVARAELKLMYGRGMPVPGPEQQAALARIKKVRRVHPNALAWQRINERRAQKGLAPLNQGEMKVVPLGKELELEEGAAPADAGPPPMTAGSVDNSALQYFPPIRDQGNLGSCAAFSTTYYQMTYMTALARGWDAQTGGDSNRFSPKWTYNMANGGSDSGIQEYDSLSVQRDHGCATWAEFPYTGNGGDYLAWCMDSNVWRTAIGRRMNDYYTIDSLYTSNGLANLKAILDNGYVVTFDTYAPWSWQGWVQGTVADDTNTANDDAFVGQQICTYVQAKDWGHSMTVVGYNDDIWCDLNGNGVVDPGEKGALKIANSWGIWANGGYAWFAYDALKNVSDVPGWSHPGKVYGFGYGDNPANCLVYVVTAKPSYTPKMLAGFTINHALRNQVTMTVGKDSGTVTNNPSVQWSGYGLSDDGGPYAFDGTTTACDGTFWLDMSDLSPDVSQSKRYFIGLTDDSSPGTGKLKSYTLVDTATGSETTVMPGANPNAFNPATGVADGNTAWGFVDHNYAAHLVVMPASSLTFGGPVGGPFNMTAQAFSLTNLGVDSLDWCLVNTSLWFTASPIGGTLLPGGSESVTVSLNSTAYSLTDGSYSASMLVSNQSDNSSVSLPFYLLIGQLVQNGGFQTGDFSYWTLSGDTSSLRVLGTPYWHSGYKGAGLKTSSSMGYISQTFPTVAGQKYLLSLWLNNHVAATPNEFLVMWNGNTNFDQVNIPVITWTNLYFIVTATAPSTVLQFGFRNDGGRFGLDDVSLQSLLALAPSFQSATQSGHTVRLSWTALAGLQYQVQYRTNLTQGSWVNTGGLVTATTTNAITTIPDVIGSDPQRFYRIQWTPPD